MFASYIDFLDDAGRAENTLKTYSLTLSAFMVYLERTGANMLEIDIKKMIDYKNYLESAGYSNNTIRLHLTVVSSFLDFLGYREYSNSTFSAIVPRETINAGYNLNDDDIYLIKQLLLQKNDHVRIIFYMMISAGLRISETVKLKSKDFRVLEGRLVADISAGKNNRARMVVFTDSETIDFIVNYVKNNNNIGKISKRTIQGHAHEMSNYLGIEFSCHSFRHYFATKLLSNGVRLDIIQELLGHKNIETTRRYAKTLQRDILFVGKKIRGMNYERNR